MPRGHPKVGKWQDGGEGGRALVRLALLFFLACALAACDKNSDYCRSLHGTPSIFCPDNPPAAGVGGGAPAGVGGGAPAGPGCDPCDDGAGACSRVSGSTARETTRTRT